MEGKEIKTPEYWKEQRFQPLVEVKSITGSTVKIPSRSKEFWEFLMKNYEKVILEQGKVNGLKIIRESLDTATIMRSRECEDFCRVFAENYQENP